MINSLLKVLISSCSPSYLGLMKDTSDGASVLLSAVIFYGLIDLPLRPLRPNVNLSSGHLSPPLMVKTAETPSGETQRNIKILIITWLDDDKLIACYFSVQFIISVVEKQCLEATRVRLLVSVGALIFALSVTRSQVCVYR